MHFNADIHSFSNDGSKVKRSPTTKEWKYDLWKAN